MSAKEQAPVPTEAPAPPKKPSKKDQIVSLWTAGIQEVSDLAHMTQTRPSYVAEVLQDAELGLIDQANSLRSSLVSCRGQFFGVAVRSKPHDLHSIGNIVSDF